MGIDFMLYFNIFIAIYVLVYAIKGSGKIYDVDYPEEAKKQYCKMLRTFCWAVGAFMLVLSIVELVLYNNEATAGIAYIFSWINIGCVIAAVVVFSIISKKRFGKYMK